MFFLFHSISGIDNFVLFQRKNALDWQVTMIQENSENFYFFIGKAQNNCFITVLECYKAFSYVTVTNRGVVSNNSIKNNFFYDLDQESRWSTY